MSHALLFVAMYHTKVSAYLLSPLTLILDAMTEIKMRMNMTEIENDKLTWTETLNQIQAHIDLRDTHDLFYKEIHNGYEIYNKYYH